jgi:hypothetical protein
MRSSKTHEEPTLIHWALILTALALTLIGAVWRSTPGVEPGLWIDRPVVQTTAPVRVPAVAQPTVITPSNAQARPPWSAASAADGELQSLKRVVCHPPKLPHGLRADC